MATTGQFSGTGTGKDPRASTAIPGTSKPSGPQRPGGGGGGISPGKLIIGGVIFLIVIAAANVVFLSLQKEKAKAESEFDLAGTESEIKGALAELKTEIGELKQLQLEQKKEMDKMKIDIKFSRNQIDFLSGRTARREEAK